MKSEKICLKKKFMCLWIGLVALLLLSILITVIPYSKYKKGQDWGIACMLVATDEFNEYKDNKKELVNEIYEYFNTSYYSYNTQYGTISNKDVIEAREEVEDSLEELLRAEGYDEGWRASFYFEYTNYLSYYLYKNYVFIIIYGIICGISLIVNILYVLSRKVEIKVNDNNIVYKKFTGKTKQFLIKDVTSAETIILRGLKLTGNGIKAKTLLLKNNEELKDYIVKLISSSADINASMADELAKYKKLLDSDAITQEEYDKMKEKILNS